MKKYPKRHLSIHFRVNDVEKFGLESLATEERRSPSEMMREILREGFIARGMSLGEIEERFQKISA